MSHETDAQDLQRFWEVEDAGVTTNLSDKTFLEQYSSSHITWQEDGSYTARFPWKDDHPPLPNSYSICQGRMRSLETYDKILKEQVDRGFIEQVTSTSSSAVHYIPHLPVLKDSSTIPIRIVYVLYLFALCMTAAAEDLQTNLVSMTIF